MDVRFLPPDVDEWIAEREILPRSSGHHVSDLVVRMLKRIDPRKYGTWGKRGPGRHSIYEVGYLWEDALSTALSRRAKTEGHVLLQPTEISRDGIYGTPDHVLWTGERFIDSELKVTWMSSRGLDLDPRAVLASPKFTYWNLQARTYAAMLMAYRINPVSHRLVWHENVWPPRVHATAPPLVRIRALFLNGPYDYGKTEVPVPMGWEIEYTAAELEAWWQNVVRESLKPPPENPHEHRDSPEPAPGRPDAGEPPDA